jgi:hypothetical protein
VTETEKPPAGSAKMVLPSGEWALLLSPDQLRGRHVRMMTRAISDMGPQRQGAVVVDWTDGAVAIAVQEWSCTGPDGQLLPVPSADLASLDEMDGLDYLDLINHRYVTEVRAKLLKLSGERATPDDHEDPASPTAPSGGSGPALRAELSPPDETTGPSGTKSRPSSGSRTGGAGGRKK